jgi:hypothetical protein
MVAPQDWAGLRALWRAVGRTAVMLLLGIVGALAGGVTLGVITAYVYFIGAGVGMIAGFVAGGIVAAKLPVRDATIYAVVGLALPKLGQYTLEPRGYDGLTAACIGIATYLVFGPLLIWLVPRLNLQTRYWIAATFAVLFAGYTFASLILWAYR